MGDSTDAAWLGAVTGLGTEMPKSKKLNLAYMGTRLVIEEESWWLKKPKYQYISTVLYQGDFYKVFLLGYRKPHQKITEELCEGSSEMAMGGKKWV